MPSHLPGAARAVWRRRYSAGMIPSPPASSLGWRRTCAKEPTGHGSPLAPLIHGGPGRAGGGEEMGGIRGVLHYMQRTAVQGSPDTLTATTGRWVRGSRLRDPGRHPFRIAFNDLEVGDTMKSKEREVTIADIAQV